MVDWRYKWGYPVRLVHRAHLPATKFLEGGPELRSNRTTWRLDLFHHAQSKVQRSLPSVPPLLRVPQPTIDFVPNFDLIVLVHGLAQRMLPDRWRMPQLQVHLLAKAICFRLMYGCPGIPWTLLER